MVVRVERKIPVIFNSARHIKYAADLQYCMILHKRLSRILPLPEAHKKQYSVHFNVQSAKTYVRVRLKFPVWMVLNPSVPKRLKYLERRFNCRWFHGDKCAHFTLE
jgi:hypothetical protein